MRRGRADQGRRLPDDLAFVQLKSAWESLEAGDIVAFENKAKLAAELETAVAGEMAACLTAAGG